MFQVAPGKAGSLKGLLAGHSSRQLEYKLEQAVKERRTTKGQRLCLIGRCVAALRNCSHHDSISF